MFCIKALLKRSFSVIIILILSLSFSNILSSQDQANETIEKFIIDNNEIIPTLREWHALQKVRLLHMEKVLQKSSNVNKVQMVSVYVSMKDELLDLSTYVSIEAQVVEESFNNWQDSLPEGELPTKGEARFKLFKNSVGKDTYQKYLRSISRKYKKTIAEVIKWNEKWYTGPMLGRDNEAIKQEKEWREFEKDLFEKFNKISAPYQKIDESYIPEMEIELSTGGKAVTTGQSVRLKVSVFGGTPPFKLTLGYRPSQDEAKTERRSGDARVYEFQLDFNEPGTTQIRLFVSDAGDPEQSKSIFRLYTVTEKTIQNQNPERSSFYARAKDASSGKSRMMQQTVDGTTPSDKRTVVAFGIEADPGAWKKNSSGAYIIKQGRSIDFKAYVTYADNLASPEDITGKIDAKGGWVNGPLFEAKNTGLHRVSADFTVIGKRRIAVTVLVEKKEQ